MSRYRWVVFILVAAPFSSYGKILTALALTVMSLNMLKASFYFFRIFTSGMDILTQTKIILLWFLDENHGRYWSHQVAQ